MSRYLLPFIAASASGKRVRIDPTAGTARIGSTDYTINPPVTPVISVERQSSSVVEGNNAVFRFSAQIAARVNLVVNFRLTATGSFIASSDLGNKSITITQGASFADHAVPTVNDTTEESAGTLTATVSTGTGYEISTTNNTDTIDLVDNDITPVLTVRRSSTQVAEGTAAAFSIHSQVSVPTNITVNLRVTQSGNYVASGDLGDKTITMSTGSTSVNYSVPTVDDTISESTGSVTLAIRSGTGYLLGTPSSIAVRVIDDDRPPELPRLTVSGGSAVAEGSAATFSINSQIFVPRSLAVNISVSQSGSYVSSSNLGNKTATLTSGRSTVDYTVPTINDSTDEADGRVTVTLRSGTGYTLGSPNSGSVTVTDNDIPTLQVTFVNQNVYVGQPALFRVSSTRPAVYADVTVRYRIDSGSIQTTTFASGQTHVDINGGTRSTEGNISLNLLSSRGNYNLGSSASHLGIVGFLFPYITITRFSSSSGVTEGSTAWFSVNSNIELVYAVTVNLSVSQSGNYVSTSNLGNKTVDIAAGTESSFYGVSTVNDTTDETNGSVTLTTRTGTGYNRGVPASASVTVLDNDASSGSGSGPTYTIYFLSSSRSGTSAQVDFTLWSSNFSSNQVVNLGYRSTNRPSQSLTGTTTTVTSDRHTFSLDIAVSDAPITIFILRSTALTGAYSIGNPSSATATLP